MLLGTEDQDLPRDFGPYELLEEIGRGGMGVVYKARQKALDRIVAVKMILATHLASPEHIRRFQVEAWAAARLRHSNITQIHDVGQHHGQHYFTMEYIEGESLAQRIARQRLSFDAIVRLLSVVARAVDHLHAQGVVHRDLKPSNILLDRDDQPYVTDFGLAKVFVPGSEATATGVIAGTPSYMAPEQASGHSSEVGPAADIYSLGAILYELLDRRAAVPAGKPAGHAVGHPRAGTALSAAAQSAGAAWLGVDLPEVPGQVAGRSLSFGRRAWPTTWSDSPGTSRFP